MNLREPFRKLHHPWIKSIIEWEWQFGLTCRESLCLFINSVTTDTHVQVYSDLAHNHQGRLIPIVTSAQRDAITRRLTVLQGNLTLTDLAPFCAIKALYRAKLHLMGYSQ